MSRSFSAVIPARFASSRLPGKPLLDLAGKPMIQHVYERARESGAETVLIATDDARIAETARAFGASVRMTAATHRSGTERVAEVVAEMAVTAEHVVVNVQGDEPLLPPALIAQVADNLSARPQVQIATLCERIADRREVFDPAVVKVVMDHRGEALYFSRAPIPWYRDHFGDAASGQPDRAHFRHIGLYAYRAGYLARYVQLEPTELEGAESLEQLRALYHGARIHVAPAASAPGPGVDTPEDLATVRRLLESRPSQTR